MAGGQDRRGLTQRQAMEYVGVKRRTWDALWAPRLVGIRQGVSLIFDRHDLDKLFEQFKAEAASNVVQSTGPLHSAPSHPSLLQVGGMKGGVGPGSLTFEAAVAQVRKNRRK